MLLVTVLLGVFALYQVLLAQAHRSAAKAYRRLAFKALESQQATIAYLGVTTERFRILREALPEHAAAAIRGDAAVCTAILREAIKRADALSVPKRAWAEKKL